MDEESSHGSTFNQFATEELTGKVVLIAMIILFMAVLIVLLFHLYARLFWLRVDQQLRQQQAPTTNTRQQRRRFIFIPGGRSTSGLEPSVLRSLPVVVFKATEFKDGLECAVCLSELVEGEKARLLPKCNHGFHVDCIDMWFQSHSTCPLCRNTVVSEDIALVRIGNESQDQNLGSGHVDNHYGVSHNPNPGSGFSMEAPNFPTNVLVWGDQNQVSSSGVAFLEDNGNASANAASASSSAGSNNQSATSSSIATGVANRVQDGAALVIDIPANVSESLSSSSTRFAEEEAKSPVTTRLRSLKRLLSREKRVVVNSSSSSTAAADV